MLPALQTRVAEFTAAHHLDADAVTRMLDLVSETGEAAKEILKTTRYGASTFSPNDAWRDELGDVMFALVCLANQTNVNLQDALDGALEKYRARIAARGQASSTD